MELELKYKSFLGSALFDHSSGHHEGVVLGTQNRVIYQAPNSESLIADFKAAVDEYIVFLEALSTETNDASHVDRPVVDLLARGGVFVDHLVER